MLLRRFKSSIWKVTSSERKRQRGAYSAAVADGEGLQRVPLLDGLLHGGPFFLRGRAECGELVLVFAVTVFAEFFVAGVGLRSGRNEGVILGGGVGGYALLSLFHHFRG